MKAVPRQLVLEKRVQKTLTYLNSETGQKNWQLNIGRGYGDDANIVAAVQTATHLIKYESIVEVLEAMRLAQPCKFCGKKTALVVAGMPSCADCQGKTWQELMVA